MSNQSVAKRGHLIWAGSAASRGRTPEVITAAAATTASTAAIASQILSTFHQGGCHLTLHLRDRFLSAQPV